MVVVAGVVVAGVVVAGVVVAGVVGAGVVGAGVVVAVVVVAGGDAGGAGVVVSRAGVRGGGGADAAGRQPIAPRPPGTTGCRPALPEPLQRGGERLPVGRRGAGAGGSAATSRGSLTCIR